MSNIAGKAYALNLITQIRAPLVRIQTWMYRAAKTPALQAALRTYLLPRTHCAHWVLLQDKDFPRLSPIQPAEELRHGYLLWLGSINCTWEQFLESFPKASAGMQLLLEFLHLRWHKGSPSAWSPLSIWSMNEQDDGAQPMWTDYYYNAHPLASARDIESAQRVHRELSSFIARTEQASPAKFLEQYNTLLRALQSDLTPISANPIVSLASREVAARHRRPAVPVRFPADDVTKAEPLFSTRWLCATSAVEEHDAE